MRQRSHARVYGPVACGTTFERNRQKPMHSNLKDEEDIMFSFYNISDWLTYVLFALFSSTYYVEFRRLDRLEMSCFQ